MTRGTLHIIIDDNVISTTEFNGDMYPEGHGDVALTMLRKVKDRQTLSEMSEKFDNYVGFNYKEKAQTYIAIPSQVKRGRPDNEDEQDKLMADNLTKGVIDFNIDYFKYWFIS